MFIKLERTRSYLIDVSTIKSIAGDGRGVEVRFKDGSSETYTTAFGIVEEQLQQLSLIAKKN